MKHPRRPAQKNRHLPLLGNRRGVALISVLAVLILLTVLVVAFLMRAESARTSSANYRAATSTRLLADTVLNLVQAEINDATTYGSSTVKTTGTAPYTWASQPGAIRVYDSSGSGTALQIYRLYSAPSLTTTTISDLIDTTTGISKEIPTNWASLPAQYVDLNAPVSVTDPDVAGVNSNFQVYPILDNRNPLNANAATPTAVPLAGAYVNAVGSNTPPTTTTGTLTPGSTTWNQPYMPVQWLYVFQNGQISAPATSTGTTVTFTNPPSASNPIIGRIAYWTDDESCKININTAGGAMSYKTDAAGNATTMPVPSPWDTPRFGGCWDDVKLFAESQPVQGEYQRYPGHPASTVLYWTMHALNATGSSTFFNLPEIDTTSASSQATSYKSGYTTTASSNDTQNAGVAPYTHLSSLYMLLPRYSDNSGSQAGLCNTTATPASNTAITPVRSRLYTSLGELLYSTTSSAASPPARTKNGVNGYINGGSDAPSSPYLTRQQVETGKFFLTAHSRAPETTLFGTPRVNMWPVPDPNHTSSEGATMGVTAFDKLLAFCSTIGKGATATTYYFQRYDRASQTNDFGSNEARNMTLYGYLQDLTAPSAGSFPGYGTGTFLTKYGTSKIATIANERDQILTEMVDYIRCTNLNDHSGTITGTTSVYCSNTSSPSMVMPLIVTSGSGGGNHTTSTTQGLGRIATLSEVGLHVICTADGSNNLASVNVSNTNTGFNTTTLTGSSVAYNTAQIVAAVSSTIPVSPVIGSASDPAYVSNLPERQFLRDTSNNIVDVSGNIISGAASAANTPFPPNPTLSNDGTYHTILNTHSDTSNLTPLAVGSKKLQAMLLFELASPMLGFDSMINGSSGPSVNIHVTGSHNITIAGLNPFPTGTPTVAGTGPNINGDGYLNGVGTSAVQWTRNGGFSCLGGIFGFQFPMLSGYTTVTWGSSSQTVNTTGRSNGWSGNTAYFPTAASNNGTDTMLGITGSFTRVTATQPYRFVSNPFTVSTSSITLGGAGSFNVSLEMPVVHGTTTSTSYQNFSVTLPTSPSLTPTLCAYGLKYVSGTTTYTSHAPDWWSFDNRIGWSIYNPAPLGATTTTPTLGWGCVIRGDNVGPSGNATDGWGTAANPWSWKTTVATISTSAGGNTGTSAGTPTQNTYGDVFRSVVPVDCDYRLTSALTGTINTDPSASNPNFMATPLYSSTANLANMLSDQLGQGTSAGTAGTDIRGSLISVSGTLQSYGPAETPKVPLSYSTVTPNPQLTYDWDSGAWNYADGAYANKPDEGNTYTNGTVTNIPYENGDNQVTNALSSYFTPNRIIASPVTFGSLPTGVAEGIPWRTLLFRPQAGTERYKGGLSVLPKDYLLLDLFTMPVVQPYAISEPFSTAGKVNMNYQILPFTHILRDTAVRAVIGSTLVARIPAADAAAGSNGYALFKGNNGWGQSTSQSTPVGLNPTGIPKMGRLPINLDETVGTLKQFQDKFNSGDIFHSPAEICDIYLVPYDSTSTTNNSNYLAWMTGGSAPTSPNLNWSYPNAEAGWYGADFGGVGDNVRERPYGDIYPRLTTKSNTFTVYYKVQALKNPPTADPTKWVEGTGVVTGEYRGSTTIERYLDPNNSNASHPIPDYTTPANNPAFTPAAPTLDNYYQWRTVANTAFAP